MPRTDKLDGMGHALRNLFNMTQLAVCRLEEWLEHEEMRLGCSPDLALFSISRVPLFVFVFAICERNPFAIKFMPSPKGLHMLSDGRVGLPMGCHRLV